jgi:hypothetical protein
MLTPIPVAEQSKARVYARCSLFAIAGSNPAEGMEVCILWVLCCQVEVFATGRSRIQRSSNECDVSECDFETSVMKRTWPTRVVDPREKKSTDRVGIKSVVSGGDFVI